jgi:serine protease Do
LEVSDIHDWIRQQLQLPRDVSGVMVTHVAPSSVLYDRGLREGDVIFEVNGEPVSSVRQFQAQVRKVKSGQLLRLYTGRWDPALRRWLKSFVIARVP